MNISDAQSAFINILDQESIDLERVNQLELKSIASNHGYRVPWKMFESHMIERDPLTKFAVYDLRAVVSLNKERKASVPVTKVAPIVANKVIAPIKVAPEVQKTDFVINNVSAEDFNSYLPSVNPGFVSYGKANDLNKVIKSCQFLPVYIYGDTGCGKSFTTVQLCARNKREVVRINVNAQTTEEDFIGGFRLVNGETIWQDGPLITAMKRGAIILIDEINSLNPAHTFALFTALEGEPVYIKKLNKIVNPAAGFNVIVTDNTKGNGTESGRFVGVNVQNSAFLDRFVLTFSFDYPAPAAERKILSCFSDDHSLCNDLITWAGTIRKIYNEDGIDEIISTRKLINILKINAVFGNIKKAILFSIDRYEEDTREAMLTFFTKIRAFEETDEVDDADIADETSF